jgi:hypothetical protein
MPNVPQQSPSAKPKPLVRQEKRRQRNLWRLLSDEAAPDVGVAGEQMLCSL